jgi:glycine oxidase
MHDVLIIGGGVMGLTTAWELARSGVKVTVLDQSQPGREASWAGAGILPPGHRGNPDDPLAPLLRRSTELWPEISEELNSATGIDNGYRRCGEIQILDDPSRLEADMQAWRVNGVRTEPLTREAFRDLEPGATSDVPAAYIVPDAAQVRNPRHIQALVKACGDLGVTILADHRVDALTRDSGRVESVETNHGPFRADRYLVAGGAWTGTIIASTGRDLEIEPVRGQMLLYRVSNPLTRHILEIGPRYVVPRDDGRILVGSTEEWVGFEKGNTPEGLAGLKAFAKRMVPLLADAPLENSWSGLRPHTRRGTPFIGRLPDCDNLFIAAGHFRAGLHLSPITARLTAQLIRGEKPELAVDAFEVT